MEVIGSRSFGLFHLFRGVTYNLLILGLGHLVTNFHGHPSKLSIICHL